MKKLKILTMAIVFQQQKKKKKKKKSLFYHKEQKKSCIIGEVKAKFFVTTVNWYKYHSEGSKALM